MKKLLIALGFVVVLVLAFGVFGIQALFTNTVVDEEIPVTTQEGVDSPVVLREGAFVQGDSTYTIEGNVSITEVNGVRSLALTDFSVTNGPDLFVYLVKSSADNDEVKEAVKEGAFLNLGKLKGNIGNQVYTIPETVVLEEGYSVSIWCKRFGRNFGSALLR